MIEFVMLSAPIFAVIALGWAAMRLHLVSAEALDALAAFSFRFALPALVFRLIGTQPLGHSFNLVFYAGYLASGGIVFGIALLISRILNPRAIAKAAARALTTTVSNVGFLGPPLVLAFFGARGSGPLAMAILAEIMVLLSIGGVIMGIASGAHTGLGAPSCSAARSVTRSSQQSSSVPDLQQPASRYPSRSTDF